MRLLLVEDEHILGRHLQRGLEEESFAVDLASSGGKARELVEVTDYDVVVLDLMLPDVSGLELLSEWRAADMKAPVLILTARDELEDKLEGFKLGADDYLTKPFAFEELLVRIRSLLRRRSAPPRELLLVGDLELDRGGRQATRAGRELVLTPKEFAVLEYLALHEGSVLDRLTLAEHVWDASYEARSNVIDVVIARLRQKLERESAPRLIHTVKGVGYVLRLTEREPR